MRLEPDAFPTWTPAGELFLERGYDGVSVDEIVPGFPTTRLSTPAGNPASSKQRATRQAVPGAM